MESVYPNPEISVIVVTYNQQDTIGRTLESILCQDLESPFEIVVNDDASTDDTARIVSEYADRFPGKIHLKVQAENLGVQRNYFDALVRCRAPLVADCAGDDYWIDKGKLRKQLDVMKSDPGITLVHTDWEARDDAGRHVDRRTFPEKKFLQPVISGTSLLSSIVDASQGIIIHLCTALYRRDVVKQVLEESPDLMLNPEYGMEDLQIICVCAEKGRIAYLPDLTLAYSVGHESVSSHKEASRNFRFLSGSFSLRHRLASRYGLRESRGFKRYRRHLSEHLAWLLSHAADIRLIRHFTMQMSDLDIRLSPKARFYLMIARIKSLFRSR